MHRFKLLGLALMAVFALGAVASSSALAENPEILPNPTALAPLTFTAEGTATSVLAPSVGKRSIECEKILAKGEFTSARLGKTTIDFHNCKSEGVKCWSLGDETSPLGNKSVILVDNADIHLVDILPLSTLALGAAVILLSELHLECQGGLLVLIKGTVIGEVIGPKTEVKTKTGELSFKQSKGVQAIKKCDLTKEFCEGKEYNLLTNFGAGFEQSGEEAKATVTFNKEAAFDF